MNNEATVVAADSLSIKDRKRVVDFVTGRAGIQLPESKQSLIESRLRKRQRLLGFSSLGEYVKHVFSDQQGSAEQVHLLDALTTNKTDFYREPNHFIFMRKHIQEQLHKAPYRYSTAPYSVWSAGCSSGEEAYTLAMELLELKRAHSHFHFRIFASDISVSCLQKAREGIYPMERIAPVNDTLRKRYLFKSKDVSRSLVAMSQQLKNCIRFEALNLLGTCFPVRESFDIIFCRNVMIYFDSAHRMEIIRRFNTCLKSHGLLIVGHSETLVGNTQNYRQLQPTIYQKINTNEITK